MIERFEDQVKQDEEDNNKMQELVQNVERKMDTQT